MSTHQHTDKNSTSTATRAKESKPQSGAHPNQILQRLENAPGSIRPADVLMLQRTIGNRATGLLLQAKLKLGPAGDQYEQEADRVAKQVVRASRQPDVQRNGVDEEELQAKPLAENISSVQRAVLAPALTQRLQQYSLHDAEAPAKQTFLAPAQMPKVQRADMDEEELQAKPLSPDMSQAKRAFLAPTQMPKVQRADMDEEELQASPNHGLEGGDVDESVAQSIQRAKGGGAPLDDGVRSSMERGFGADFSGVRVHTGGQADALNRSLNARAFTTGNDIFFGKGQYSPGSTGGQELIAHELTHTVQQGAAAVQKKPMAPQEIQRDDAHGPACKCGSCNGVQRHMDEDVQMKALPVQRSDTQHGPVCKCGSCNGVQRHMDEDVQMKALPVQRSDTQHGPVCKCGSCSGGVQRHMDEDVQMKPLTAQRGRGANNAGKMVQAQLQRSVVHVDVDSSLQRYSRDVIQRHSSWEHKSLGDANPDDLSKIGAWQDLIAQTTKDGPKGLWGTRQTDNATVNVPIGDDGTLVAVNKGDVMHILAQHLNLLDQWQTDPPLHGTAGKIDPTYQTVLVEVPGGGKDGVTPLVVTYGELNTLADYYGNVETMNAADPAIRWRMVQSVRKETFLRLKDIYDQVNSSLTDTEKGQQGVGDAQDMLAGNKLFNQKRDKVPGLSNQFMFDDSIQQDYISSVIGQVNLLKKSGTGTDKGGTNNYSATLARNACHFVPESWHAWSSYHQKARTLAAQSNAMRTSANLLLQQVGGIQSERDQQNYTNYVKEANRLANEAILNNGFGDHYLQDSYAGGHMINKTLIMKWFVEWLDQNAAKMDFASDENWRKVQAIAYRQPEFAKAISGDDGQYDKSQVQGYDPQDTVNKAQNPQAVEDIGGEDWMVRFKALGLQVPASLRTAGSNTRKIVEWWQQGAGAGRFQSKTTVNGQRLLNSGLGFDKPTLITALNALLADGVIHPDATSEKRSTKKGKAFLSGQRQINPNISDKTFNSLKFVLRKEYVPDSKNMSRFNATLQTGNNDAYQKMAAMVTYQDYFAFMNNGYMQKSTNALHNTFCTNGLTISSGDGTLVDAKVYGDDAMFNEGSSEGVKHSAETAHMSRDAIRNIIDNGDDGGITTAGILDRLPDTVTADVFDDKGKLTGTSKMEIATWHNPNNGGTLKNQCFTKIFPKMGAVDKIVGAMGGLTDHLSKDQVHAGDAF